MLTALRIKTSRLINLRISALPLQDNRGFTLLELIITLLIIAVIIGISSVMFASRQPSEQIKSAARDIVSTVRYARMLARSTGEQKVMAIDMESGNFGIEGKGTRTLPKGSVVIVNDPVNGIVSRGIYRIEFYPSGLSGFADIAIEGHNRKIDIHIDPVIGAYVVK